MAEKPYYLLDTFAERKAAREKAAAPEPKQVDAETEEVEDKAVKPAKATRKRAAAKKS